LLHRPLPPRLSASLTGRFPSREACGLTTFRIGTIEWSRSRLFADGHPVYGKEWGTRLHLTTCLLAQAYQRLWLAGSHDV